MKQMIKKLCLAMMITGCVISSCKKDNNGPDLKSGTQLSFGVKADNSSATLTANAVGVNATAASVTWTSGIANISGFKFEAKKSGLETEIKSSGLAQIDLFALSTPLIDAAIDTGVYREIEIKVMLSKTSTTNLPLTLKGNFNPASGTAIPVEIDFNDDAVIKAELENVTVDGSVDLTSIVTLRLNKLLTNISAADLTNATRTNGIILISSTVNSTLYNKIKSNLSSCGESHGFERHDKSERHR